MMRRLAAGMMIAAAAGVLLTAPVRAEDSAYVVGVDDVLHIAVLQPEVLETDVTVAPDGTISFPYIGNLTVRGMSLDDVRAAVQEHLADGYMKYPVAAVSLRESRSRKFFVYGGVVRPGSYALDEKTTVLKAISIAGGFTKFGSSSRVKILRSKTDEAGYETLKVNINEVMDGKSEEDVLLAPGDIVVVSEGMF